jgi:capsular exopolysaccharide synthesis family protein
VQTPKDPINELTVSLFPEIDLKVYARILWHWAWLIVLCTLLAAASAFIASSFTIPIYKATSTLLIDQANNPQANYQDLITSERIARTYAELMQRKKLLASVAQKLGIETEVLAATLANISVTPTRDTQLVQVSIEGTSPELTAWVANQLPIVFIEEINALQTERYAESKSTLEAQLADLKSRIDLANAEIDGLSSTRTVDEEIHFTQLREELAQYQGSYTSLLGRYEEIRLAELQSTDSITIVDEAIEPEVPIRPRVLVNTLLAAIVGAMLALGVIFLVEYLDDRIKTPQDLHSVLDAPILGTIAQIGKQRRRQKQLSREDSLIVASQPRHPVAESYRRLRTNLRFSSVNEPLRTLLVTSATPAEGKTITAANLATAVAQSGYRVVIIDADLRKPQLHKIFNLSKGPGLTDALLSGGESLFFLRNSDVPNLQVLTCGSIPPNPAELLGSKPMQRLLQQLQTEVDFVIIDTPPLLAVTDAQILAGHVQGALLVVNANSTSRALVASAANALLQVEARLLGVVLNQLTRSARSYYYYDAYADYCANQDDDEMLPALAAAHKSLEPAGRPMPAATAVKVSSAATSTAYELQDNQSKNSSTNGYYQLNPTQDR